MNYLRFDLTYCSENSLKWLIRYHEELTDSLIIKGLSNLELKSIIHDYCISNNIEKENYLCHPLSKEKKERVKCNSYSMIQEDKNINKEYDVHDYSLKDETVKNSLEHNITSNSSFSN